jgi:hypothetical protein
MACCFLFLFLTTFSSFSDSSTCLIELLPELSFSLELKFKAFDVVAVAAYLRLKADCKPVYLSVFLSSDIILIVSFIEVKSGFILSFSLYLIDMFIC